MPGERTAASPDGAPDAPPPAAVTTGHAQDRKRRGEGQRWCFSSQRSVEVLVVSQCLCSQSPSNMFCRTRKWFQGRTLISHTDCTSAVFLAKYSTCQSLKILLICLNLMCPSCLATVGLCFRGVNGCLMRAGLRKLDHLDH